MLKKMKALPVGSVEEILKSVWDGESFGSPYDEMINRRFDPVDFIRFQAKPDPLTVLLYKKDESGRVIFPLAKPEFARSASPLHGYVGMQTSRYHKEDTGDHIAYVLAGVYREIAQEHRPDEMEVLLMALLHDAGRKYDTATNYRGEICFYGHEQLSAYFAAAVYRQLGYSAEQAEPYIRAIHGHMLPFNVWGRYPGTEDEYTHRYGASQTELVRLINRHDKGATSYAELREMEPMFAEGRRIAAELGRRLRNRK